MGYAIITPEGSIRHTCIKLTAYDRIAPGEKIVEYSFPLLDVTLYDISPITPVVGDVVLFNTVLKPQASEIILQRNLVKIDADVDDIYRLAIGNRGPEYTQAEKEAIEFAANNYIGSPPPYILSWIAATGWTAEVATNDILTQATTWRYAATQIREKRLKAKADLRNAVPNTLDTWNAFVLFVRSQLGI